MQVVEAVRLISVMFLIVATVLSGCTGGRGADTSSPPSPAPSPTTAVQATTTTRATESPGPTASPAVNQTPSATLTTVAEAAPSGCADLECPALVLVPPPGSDTDPRRFILADPEGEAFCSLGAPHVPSRSAKCQVVGEGVMCWDETRNALQVLDVRSGETEYVDPELEEETRLDFLVSPDGTRIIWSTTFDATRADVPEGTSRCGVTITSGDGSSAETLLEKRYDNLYHVVPVTWTSADDAVLFARMRVWIESGGAFIPTFSGRYSELFRLDLATADFQNVFPLGDAAVCNRCIGDVSPEGRWLAYHREDGALVLRDLVGGEETLVAGASSACYLGRARFGPDGEHMIYTELEGPCDEQDTFDVARTLMVDVPFSGGSRVLAESREAVDWPVGWLDGETPIFDRVYKSFDQRGRWVAGQSAAPEDLLPGILIGVVRPSPTGTSEGASDQ